MMQASSHWFIITSSKWSIEANIFEAIFLPLIGTVMVGFRLIVPQSSALCGKLGAFLALAVFLSMVFDATPTNHLFLITNSKMTLWNIVREALNAHELLHNYLSAHGLPWNYINHGRIKRFLKFRALFQLLTMTVIHLFFQLSTLESYLSWVTVQYRNRASTDLVSVVQGNHLSREASCSHWWVIFAVSSNIAVVNIFDRHSAGMESHNVLWKNFTHNITVHFSRLYFGCDTDWSKDKYHARFEGASLFSSYRDSTNTINFYGTLGKVQAKVCQSTKLEAECHSQVGTVWFH